MFYKAELPILNLSTVVCAVVFKIEAENEEDAVNQAKNLWHNRSFEVVDAAQKPLQVGPGIGVTEMTGNVSLWMRLDGQPATAD